MDNNNAGKFLNGFLLGAVIGGGIVFLLSSKKGKKLLRTLSEEGLDKVSDLLEEQEEIIDDNKETEQQEPLSKPSPEGEKETNGETKHAQTTNKKPLVKRFFKGISRRR